MAKPRNERTLTPTTRTIRKLLREGWLADEVERRITQFLKRDLFGFADVLAVRDDGGMLFVQCTSDNGGNLAKRVDKILAEPRAKALARLGKRIEVWGWKRTSDEPRVVRLDSDSAWVVGDFFLDSVALPTPGGVGSADHDTHDPAASSSSGGPAAQ